MVQLIYIRPCSHEAGVLFEYPLGHQTYAEVNVLARLAAGLKDVDPLALAHCLKQYTVSGKEA